MSSEFIDSYLVLSVPVQITVAIESYHLPSAGREGQLPVGYALEVRMGGRFLSRMTYPYRPARVLLEGGVLDDPVRLALRAFKSAGREQGLLRVAMAATPTTAVQEAKILDADRSLPETMALWQLPDDQVGIRLGDRWFPAGPAVLAPVPVGPDMGEQLLEFEAACRPFFDRILVRRPDGGGRAAASGRVALSGGCRRWARGAPASCSPVGRPRGD
jgi:hypothetical protein